MTAIPADDDKARWKPFLEFWDGLDPKRRSEFERAALHAADPLKRRWHDEATAAGRQTAEYFRTAILRDHFERVGSSEQHDRVAKDGHRDGR